MHRPRLSPPAIPPLCLLKARLFPSKLLPVSLTLAMSTVCLLVPGQASDLSFFQSFARMFVLSCAGCHTIIIPVIQRLSEVERLTVQSQPGLHSEL